MEAIKPNIRKESFEIRLDKTVYNFTNELIEGDLLCINTKSGFKLEDLVLCYDKEREVNIVSKFISLIPDTDYSNQIIYPIGKVTSFSRSL